MTMGPAMGGLETWDTADPRNTWVTLDCFLPTGVYVPLKVNQDATLCEIKDKLWHESQQYPLYASLRDRNSYHFMCINQMAEKEELVDEDKRVCEVRPFMQMLRVVERRGDKTEKAFNNQISFLIGKGLHEFDAIQAPEVGDFRKKVKQDCKNISKKREQQGWLERALYLYPPDVTLKADLPAYLKEQVKDQLFLKIYLPASSSHDVTMMIDVPFSSYPEEVIRSIVVRKPQFKLPSNAEHKYVLKVCGRDEYLLGSYPLSQFNYIRKVIARQKIPSLLLISIETLTSTMPPQLHPRPEPRRPPSTPIRQLNTRSQYTWTIEDLYQITITKVTNIISEEGTKVCVRAGIYHGGEIMCPHNNTAEVSIMDGFATFTETLTFDIQVADIPRMARLCFLFYCIVDHKAKGRTTGKRVKYGKQEIRTLAWVNIPVFDYRDRLRAGCHRLFMWPITDDNVLTEEQLNALGTVEGNPSSEEAVSLVVDIRDYNRGDPVLYPPKEKVLQLGESLTEKKSLELKGKQLQPVKQLIDRDPLEPLHEQDKERIWMLRMECHQYFPEVSLPKLLLCVNWNKHTDVAQMQLLLKRWPPKLAPAKALELLDFNYPDKEVRSFAVKCLQELPDVELTYYLLQLVQVLKYECYLECELVDFLLKRALYNQRIGHYFFWLLRSEMHVPSVSVRFGLILEAYCHGCLQHVQPLTKQVQALSKLKALTLMIRNYMKKSNNPTQATEEMRNILKNRGYSEALSNLSSPLDPRFKLTSLQYDKCRFMDSKMKPLWMVWDHGDHLLAPEDLPTYIMYKAGDDLRQDMLTLQIIGIMERIWQEKGYDLRMTPYTVLATGCNEGLIETVFDAQTIGKIQQKYTNMKVTAALNEKCIYQFLEDSHKDSPESLKTAVEEFTLSCAGYCVATYVLGIGDRHADNIMMKKNGQMFHIDFGHILGHFKSKFGYRRERVPFVLTSDFIYVINNGAKLPKEETPAFKRFCSLCEEAYLALHEQCNLLITLFLMMMNTGIPELSNLSDIEYLKKTLVPGSSTEDARLHFRKKFYEAHEKSSFSTLNNVFHHLNN